MIHAQQRAQPCNLLSGIINIQIGIRDKQLGQSWRINVEHPNKLEINVHTSYVMCLHPL